MNKYLFNEYAKETKEFRENGGIVLSPSGVSKFFNEPNEWYLDRLGQTTFDGNTNTVLGNAIHGAIDGFWEDVDVTTKDVEEWIDTVYQKQMNEIGYTDNNGMEQPKVDKDKVLENFLPMLTAWKENYASKYPKPDKREYPLSVKMTESMILAGTIDGYEKERGVIIDYKTCHRKPSGISEGHRLQLLTYAFMMIANGYEVNTFRIVYIQSKTKTLPARIWTFDEEITDKMLFRITEYIELMKDSFMASIEYPHLTGLLFRPNPVSKW